MQLVLSMSYKHKDIIHQVITTILVTIHVKHTGNTGNVTAFKSASIIVMNGVYESLHQWKAKSNFVYAAHRWVDR